MSTTGSTYIRLVLVRVNNKFISKEFVALANHINLKVRGTAPFIPVKSK